MAGGEISLCNAKQLRNERADEYSLFEYREEEKTGDETGETK